MSTYTHTHKAKVLRGSKKNLNEKAHVENIKQKSLQITPRYTTGLCKISVLIISSPGNKGR